jgi:hypothetical protein
MKTWIGLALLLVAAVLTLAIVHARSHEQSLRSEEERENADHRQELEWQKHRAATTVQN